MAIKRRSLPAVVFIWRGNEQIFYPKKDMVIAQNVVSSPVVACGFAGSNVIDEQDPIGIQTESIGPIINDAGQRLRFATATQADARRLADVRAKIAAMQPLFVATSYPNPARRLLWQAGIAPIITADFVQPGGIEALPGQYPEVDIIFELVQSGDSLRENGLEIIDDDIAAINLLKVDQRLKSNLGYNGGQDGTINSTL